MFARMRPATEVMPDIVRRAGGQRGPQKSKPVKTLVSLRLDPDVIGHFRRSGPGWQSRINQALRKAAKLSKTDAADDSGDAGGRARRRGGVRGVGAAGVSKE